MKSIRVCSVPRRFLQLVLPLVCCLQTGLSTAEERYSVDLNLGASGMSEKDLSCVKASVVYDRKQKVLGYSAQGDRRVPYFAAIGNFYHWPNDQFSGSRYCINLYRALEENYHHWQHLSDVDFHRLKFPDYQFLSTIYCDTLNNPNTKAVSAFLGASRARDSNSFKHCRQWLDSALSEKAFLANHFDTENSPVVLVPEWLTDKTEVKSGQEPLVRYLFNPLFHSFASQFPLSGFGGSLLIIGDQSSLVQLKRLQANAWLCYPDCQITGENLKWSDMEASGASGADTLYTGFETNIPGNNVPYLLTGFNNTEYLLYHTGKQVHVWQIGSEWSKAHKIISLPEGHETFEVVLSELPGAELPRSSQ
ncbi:MAG: hypothetical protein ACR2PT_16500 [Endozoicomonas sp.]